MTKKTLTSGIIVCYMIFCFVGTVIADDLESLNDEEGDVYVFDDYLNYEETGDLGDMPSTTTDEMPNIDIKKITYSKGDGEKEVTLTFEVFGEIEDSGYDEDILSGIDENTNLSDFDWSELFKPQITYQVILTTDEQIYTISYTNKISTIIRGEDSIDMEDINSEKDGSELIFTFDLDDEDEEFLSMEAMTMSWELLGDWMSAITGGSDDASVKFYADMAPNPLAVEISATEKTKTGREVEFIVDVEDGTGPYQYLWEFGDGNTSTSANPKHTYETADTYYVYVEVTDADGKTGTGAHEIEVLAGSSNGNDEPVNGGGDSGLLVFAALIILVIIVGVGVVFYFVRR